MCFLLLLYWVERPFQQISGHIRTVPVCNIVYDHHFIVRSHCNIAHRRHSRMISHPPVTLFWYQSFDKGVLTTILILLESNPGPPRHGANALPEGYRAGRIGCTNGHT